MNIAIISKLQLIVKRKEAKAKKKRGVPDAAALAYQEKCRERALKKSQDTKKLFKEELKILQQEQTSAFTGVQLSRLYEEEKLLKKVLLLDNRKCSWKRQMKLHNLVETQTSSSPRLY
ncbi:unnamed protein product [Nezara viridula]|uniref:Uncharacterized protein n=1 Tax=Nezara viridula TaxID=85310 RepID=A0A9P0HDV2_NEZVI|nr:unnamed protein product [Nezara viridula]